MMPDTVHLLSSDCDFTEYSFLDAIALLHKGIPEYQKHDVDLWVGHGGLLEALELKKRLEDVDNFRITEVLLDPDLSLEGFYIVKDGKSVGSHGC